LFLRSNSRLYSDVGGRRSAFAYFPLAGDGAVGEPLTAFSPTILIAPAHRLVDIAAAARSGLIRLPDLRQIWFGAEPMSEAERDWAGEALGVRPQPLYQATEGFLGAACRFGRLHLNEHSLEIELEPVAGTHGFRPIVTDLRRRSQPIVRVRMDDFLELDPAPCGCGYNGRTIFPPAMRVGDLWRFGERIVYPLVAAEIIDNLLFVPTRWRAEASPLEVSLTVEPSADRHRAERAARAVAGLLPDSVPVDLRFEAPPSPRPKRRRLSWSANGG
jgi:putative adenylate-forming enzyme